MNLNLLGNIQTCRKISGRQLKQLFWRLISNHHHHHFLPVHWSSSIPAFLEQLCDHPPKQLRWNLVWVSFPSFPFLTLPLVDFLSTSCLCSCHEFPVPLCFSAPCPSPVAFLSGWLLPQPIRGALVYFQVWNLTPQTCTSQRSMDGLQVQMDGLLVPGSEVQGQVPPSLLVVLNNKSPLCPSSSSFTTPGISRPCGFASSCLHPNPPSY